MRPFYTKSAPSATNPGPTAATLQAAVTPNGYPTTAWFEWGITTNYGVATPPQTLGRAVTNIAKLSNATPNNPDAAANSNDTDERVVLDSI